MLQENQMLIAEKKKNNNIRCSENKYVQIGRVTDSHKKLTCQRKIY